MTERVLVTGGAGYIGSHTLVDLLLSDQEVVVLDSLVNGHEEAINRVQQIANCNIDLIVGDVRDREILNDVLSRFRPEKVVHFAGLKSVGESSKIPLHYYDVNVNGTRTLLSAMEDNGCEQIVFSSSATVYGTPNYLPLDESHPTQPGNPYGHSKLMAEQIIADWCDVRTSRAAISLRYFNPVGAHPTGRIGEDPRGTPNNLMPYVAWVAADRLPALRVFGKDYETRDGTGERDYIHVVDLARAHLAALQSLREHKGHQIINVGTGRGYTVLEIVAAFERASGREINLSFTERRPGDAARSVADPSTALQKLNWSSAHNVEDMCRSAWKWQMNNPTGYEIPRC